MQNGMNLCPENLVRKNPCNKNTAEKEMIQNVIKQAPSKVPTIPKKGI